jgi:hypothetical protein
MATGRDVARFVSQLTGGNFVGLYDEAEKNDEMMKNEAQEKFKSLVERMNKVDKNNKKEIID